MKQCLFHINPFSLFSPRQWSSKETKSRCFIFQERAVSPNSRKIPGILILTKISYREGIMNHELGAHRRLWEPVVASLLLPTFHHPKSCLSPGIHGKTALKNEAWGPRSEPPFVIREANPCAGISELEVRVLLHRLRASSK